VEIKKIAVQGITLAGALAALCAQPAVIAVHASIVLVAEPVVSARQEKVLGKAINHHHHNRCHHQNLFYSDSARLLQKRGRDVVGQHAPMVIAGNTEDEN
jgi:hypothetical protein